MPEEIDFYINRLNCLGTVYSQCYSVREYSGDDPHRLKVK